jgi:AAA ATPase domain/AAA domain, putative AbiEii toxin, Type IV TA system/Protein of unknown function (DUF3696)
MILKALTLENFKGIRDPVRIEFAPVTLLFGPNNAGKSTIVQALIYAREVLERNNTDAGRTQLGGDVIDLGGFKNLVHGHDLNRVIRMRFELDLSEKGLPDYSEWVRRDELEIRVSFQYLDAPNNLDIASASKVRSRLKQVWVEVQIAWNRASNSPHVSTYSVGTGPAAYATINMSGNNGEPDNRASLSYFDFGSYPFGSRFPQADPSPYGRELASLARMLVRKIVFQYGKLDLGLTEGAEVAMTNEVVQENDNKMRLEDFERIVSDIIQGNGDWGDDSVNEETGKQNPYYIKRKELLEVAEARAAVLKPVKIRHIKLDLAGIEGAAGTPEQKSETSIELDESQSETLETIPDAKLVTLSPGLVIDKPKEDGSPLPDLDSIDLDLDLDIAEPEESDTAESETYSRDEIEGWMLDLFRALVKEYYISIGDDEDPMPLDLKSTALPEWGRRLEFDPRVWLPDEENDYWEPANLIMAQEYLKDLLTAVITGPGERLLAALKESVYLSPFREMPPRHYQPAHSPESRRWANGLAAWDWLMLEGKTLVLKVNEWLTGQDRLNAGYRIEVTHYKELDIDSPLMQALSSAEPPGDQTWLRQQLEGLPEGRRLQIRGDTQNGIALFPQDLGVGMSQVVPVLVAALHNTQGIVAIEEPESNIHPAFQVVLADLFITQTQANPGVMFLVETHSEHLMLRCLRRIRETVEGDLPEGNPALSPEGIAVHFVEPDDSGQRVHRIRIDGDGDFIDPWPSGFFRERIKELYGDDL